MGNSIPLSKIKSIFGLYHLGEVNILRASCSLKITRTTVRKYLLDISFFITQNPASADRVDHYISHLIKKHNKVDVVHPLFQHFPMVLENIMRYNSNRILEWRNYRIRFPHGYCYTTFTLEFSRWCKAKGVSMLRYRPLIRSIPEADIEILMKWKRGQSDKRKWERAVAIFECFNGKPISEIASKIERSSDRIKDWINLYKNQGLNAFEKKPRKRNEKKQRIAETKKANLIALIHESPSLHGINRASWSLKSLGQAYQNKYNSFISLTSISDYIRSEGYRFRKAKETLTSPDPNFREKLEKIKKILSNLRPDEKFFSVDEFGPFAVKIKGGRSLVKRGEVKTYPQIQASKGRIICTAALELSQNQVTHFYSQKKDTDEMILLVKLLLEKYHSEKKIYFSWDAASWHGSKKLYKRIAEINDRAQVAQTPVVELAPLPSSAQFLNVIESVFSGMAKAIIHNSDYQSMEQCKSAIDLYFKERNDHFKKNPKRAGNKIWGKELAAPVFDETKNFKDPRWR